LICQLVLGDCCLCRHHWRRVIIIPLAKWNFSSMLYSTWLGPSWPCPGNLGFAGRLASGFAFRLQELELFKFAAFNLETLNFLGFFSIALNLQIR
jgi:hypothetical protein